MLKILKTKNVNVDNGTEFVTVKAVCRRCKKDATNHMLMFLN